MSDKNAPAQVHALSSALIVFQGGQIIVPSNAVAEVLPYAPSLSLENAPPWVVGTMLWQADPIPLINLDKLLLQQPPEDVQYRRIIVLNMLTPHPRLRYFGLLSTDAPQRVLLQRNDLVPSAIPSQPPVGALSYAALKGRQVLIPDLDMIEAELVQVVRRGSR
ncbi:MAG: chemotaxis protein CheW [Gammaproteobacteria bacterium]